MTETEGRSGPMRILRRNHTDKLVDISDIYTTKGEIQE
jgi:hypothetical protein